MTVDGGGKRDWAVKTAGQMKRVPLKGGRGELKHVRSKSGQLESTDSTGSPHFSPSASLGVSDLFILVSNW